MAVPHNGTKTLGMGSSYETAVLPSCPLAATCLFLRPNSSGQFCLQRDVDGEVHLQLGKLPHLKKEGHTFLEFLTINFATGAAERFRECESENEYETCVRRKGACDRRQPGWTCRVLAREPPVQPDQGRRSSSRWSSERKALGKVHKVRRMSGSPFFSP